MELEQENSFYDAHQTEFRENYPDKWLVITGETLWGVYDRFADAAKDALENLEPGKIMIHKPSDDGKVIKIPSFRFRNQESSEKPKLPKKMIFTDGELQEVTYPY